jgi:hypothetical protein
VKGEIEMKKQVMLCLSLLLCLPLCALAQSGPANSTDRETVRRELEYRLEREKGSNVEVRIETAESYFVSNGETGVRGRAQLRERGGRWDTIWYDTILDTRRNRATRVEWGYGDRAGERRDYRDQGRNDNRTLGGLRGGRYEIQLVATGRVLDIGQGGQVVQRTSNGARSQQWDIEDAGNGYYYLRSAETGDVMAWQGDSNGAGIVLTRQRRGDQNQLWEVRSGPDNGYYFIARNGRSMDSPSSARNEGGRIQLYSRNGEANQRFLLRQIDDRARLDERPRDRDRFNIPPRDSRGAGRMTWRGRVDDVVELEIRDTSARERRVSGQPTYGVRVQFDGALPRREVNVRVNRLRGRGRVEVIEQPSNSNGYVAVIRITDSDRGADDYEIEVSWN